MTDPLALQRQRQHAIAVEEACFPERCDPDAGITCQTHEDDEED